MKREFFKTMLLYFLVITSLFLTLNIWSGKQANSDDTSLVYGIKSFFSSGEKETLISEKSVSFSDCCSLKWIAVSCNDKKSVSYLGEDSYNDFYSFFSLVKTDITKAGTLSSLNRDDFNNAFKGNGVCVKFSSYISLCDYLKCGEAFFDDGKDPYTDILFLSIPSDASSMKYMYFCDKNTKNNYRLPVNYGSDKLVDDLISLSSTAEASDSFSFELNFDRKTDNVERILIDSLVPVSISEKTIKVLEAENITYNSHSDIYDSVFRAFNIKKNSARSYTDADGVMGFIENHATLKIRSDGYFQYETDESFEGISLGETDSVEAVVSFVNKLYKSCVKNNAFLCLENYYEKDDVTTYEFSYATDCGSLYNYEESCVTLKVKKGNIVFYRQRLLNVFATEKSVNTGTLLNAYDDMYNYGLPKSKSELSVTGLYPVNVYNKSGAVEQKWYCEFSDGSGNFL